MNHCILSLLWICSTRIYPWSLVYMNSIHIGSAFIPKTQFFADIGLTVIGHAWLSYFWSEYLFNLFIFRYYFIFTIWTQFKVIRFIHAYQVVLACLAFKYLKVLPLSIFTVFTVMISLINFFFLFRIFILTWTCINFLWKRKVLRILSSSLIVIDLWRISLELSIKIRK